MPETALIPLCLLVLFAPACEALRVSGTTAEGTAFAGSLVSTASGELLLETGKGSNATQWGTPLESVGTISLLESFEKPLETLEALEAFGSLLPLWDEGTRIRLVEAVAKVVASGHWHAGYRWSSRLLELRLAPESRFRMALGRCWCLLEMGLVQAAIDAAKELIPLVDPMTAPDRFCWLMARLAIETGDRESATKWIRLPCLQIPSAEVSLTAELEPLLEGIESRTKPLRK